MLSYRVAFVGDLLAIAVQAVMFGFIAGWSTRRLCRSTTACPPAASSS